MPTPKPSSDSKKTKKDSSKEEIDQASDEKHINTH
jgi:hypothetical protein